VATALGIFLVFSPLAVLIAALAFAAVLWKWQYVSLGSIIAAALVPILVAGFERSLPLAVATCFISAMVIIRHRDNIRRLLAGTENRFKA
jgi:glycerol-3-phosphate acyltransferase PlsY